MQTTEEEAKSKLCVLGSAAHARQGNCVGRACMAWRWTNFELKEAPRPILFAIDYDRPTHGMCGLVGNPTKGPV